MHVPYKIVQHMNICVAIAIELHSWLVVLQTCHSVSPKITWLKGS